MVRVYPHDSVLIDKLVEKRVCSTKTAVVSHAIKELARQYGVPCAEE